MASKRFCGKRYRVIKMKIKYIECCGAPREMGRMYGESARSQIRHNLDFFKISPDITVDVERFKPGCPESVYQELEGIAEGAATTLPQIIAMNQWQCGLRASDDCTPMAVSAGSNIFCAKNNDGNAGDDYCYVCRKTEPEHGIPLLQVTYAGWLSGLDALNAEGLANTHGSVGSTLPRPDRSLDIRLAAYHLMRHVSCVADFVNGLRRFPLTGKGFNVVVADADGRNAVIEAAVPELMVRDQDKPFVYTTNHFLSDVFNAVDTRSPEGKEISTLRLGYLKKIEETNPPAELEQLKNILSSHDSWAPCRHGGVQHSFTEWSLIADISNRQIMLAGGAPCRHSYKTIGF